MLKGINKQMVEIIDTGSIYFEKALLVLDPTVSIEQKEVYDEAVRIFTPKKIEESQNINKAKFAALMAGFTVLGSLVTFLVMRLI